MQRSFSYILLITSVFLYFSCNTKILRTNVEAKNIAVSDSISSLDSQVVEVYLPYKKMLEKDMSKVISISEKEMIKNKPESSLTNFLADLLLYEGTKEAKSKNLNVIPEISYFNYGGIRTSLPAGEITVGKIYELMPFENEMVYLKLSGGQIQQFLNNIAEKGGSSIGGVRFSIKNDKATNIEVAGNSLELSADYWLVTNDYVAGGGDNMDVLTQRSELINSGEKIRDVIIGYLEEKQQNDERLQATKDGRIKYE